MTTAKWGAREDYFAMGEKMKLETVNIKDTKTHFLTRGALVERKWAAVKMP